MADTDPARLLLIIKLGIQMREAQKTYFKNRDRTDLVRSKDLEKRFDMAAAEAVKP